MNYFAYGSNLLHARLQARTPVARVLGTGILEEHDSRFHKRGTDGSGKCDAFYTGASTHCVHGVVYHLDDAARAVLDRIEGVGCGYCIKEIVLAVAGTSLDAFTYVVEDAYIDPNMQPFHWYKRFVVEGARQNGFPPPYIAAIDAVVAKIDPDEARRRRNVAIAAT